MMPVITEKLVCNQFAIAFVIGYQYHLHKKNYWL